MKVATGAFALDVARSSAAMMLTTRNTNVLVFLENESQFPTTRLCRGMILTATVYSCYLRKSAHNGQTSEPQKSFNGIAFFKRAQGELVMKKDADTQPNDTFRFHSREPGVKDDVNSHSSSSPHEVLVPEAKAFLRARRSVRVRRSWVSEWTGENEEERESHERRRENNERHNEAAQRR